MDILLGITLGGLLLVYGALFYRAVLDCRRGFPHSIDDIDKVKDRYRDRYYLKMTFRPQIFLAIAA